MHRTVNVILRALFCALVATVVQQAHAISYITLDNPLGAKGTVARGIDANNIVGTYTEASNATRGFLYDGSSFTTINSGFSTSTEVNGINSNNIVGNASIDGFLYDSSTTTQLDYPGSIVTQALGVSGNSVVGFFQDATTYAAHGFLYDGTSYTQLDHPLAIPSMFSGSGDTVATGISGTTIVGYYTDALATHGFIYDGASYTTLDNPAGFNTIIWGISGNLIVGQYMDAGNHFHGFVYDGTNFTTIDIPAANGYTAVFGVSGNTIVGTYGSLADYTNRHGFVATVPEPSTLVLAVLGGGMAILAVRRRRVSRRKYDRCIE